MNPALIFDRAEVLATVESGRVAALPGVRRLAQEALSAGWRVGVLLGCHAEQVARAALGPELMHRVSMAPGEVLPGTTPTADTFTTFAAALPASPSETVVLTHDRVGLLAAVSAGMSGVVVPTAVTFHDDFSAADLVMSGLGEPDGQPEVVLGGQFWTRARPLLLLADLAALTATVRPARAAARE